MSSIFNKKNLKIIAGILLFVYIFLLFVNPVNSEDEAADSNDEKPIKPERKIDKLQIGIKKRVENCERRSKSNDVLHIHYEVVE